MIASIDLTSTATNMQIWQVPSGQIATVNIRFTNRTTGNVKIGLIVSTDDTPDNSNFYLFNTVIYPNDVYTECGLVLNAGDFIYGITDTVGVNVVVTGWTQATA